MSYTLAPQLSWTDTDEGMVLLNEESGSYLTLNRTGADVLHCVLDGHSVSEVVDRLSKAHPQAADRIAGDVDELMASFARTGVLRR